MKKSLFALVGMTVALLAESGEKIDMKKNMQEMEVSMAQIQKGFLYNDPSLVKNGVVTLRERVKNIEPPSKEDEEMLGKGNTYSYKYAKEQSAKISALAQELLTNYNANERYSAMNRYKDTLKQCLACHTKIRKW